MAKAEGSKDLAAGTRVWRLLPANKELARPEMLAVLQEIAERAHGLVQSNETRGLPAPSLQAAKPGRFTHLYRALAH